MSGAVNLVDVAHGASVGLDRVLAEVTGAKGEGLLAAAVVLKRAIKHELSVPGTEDAPAPRGSAPHRLTAAPAIRRAQKLVHGSDIYGALFRSIGFSREGDVMRVGSRSFVSRLQELRGHPFMDAALRHATEGDDAMTGAFVGVLQVRVARDGHSPFANAGDARPTTTPLGGSVTP